MRSRTEMVTTTFVDSEEDYSDDDDSEEDWRPSASSKNGKKQKHQKSSGAAGKKGRKRKGASATGNKNLKRKLSNDGTDDDDMNDMSDDEYDENDDLETMSGSSSKNKPTGLPPKKQFSEKNSSISSNDDTEDDTFNLLVYVKDLAGLDLNKDNRLCLWRKDKNNLLQKYIRVKTSPEEFLFTPSSVYSSFEDKRISDFYGIKVKPIDSTNRRVKIINPSQLQKICLKDLKNKSKSNDDKKSDMPGDQKPSKGNLKKSVPKNNEDDDDDDEEEVDEENDEEEDDSELEGDDEDDIEEYDETDN